MCGRFTLKTPTATLAEWFGGDPPADLPMRYNIAPTQTVAIVRIESSPDRRQWRMARWGLVPAWAKDPAIGSRMINARVESVAERPAFRAAFRRRRCLVPADGYFEWQPRGRAKQPFYIRLADDQPFGIAGLWEAWRNTASGETLESCTVLTTEANLSTRPIHDRMPVILDPADYAAWLDPTELDAANLRAMLRPLDDLVLRADPVDAFVNNARNEGARCVALTNCLF